MIYSDFSLSTERQQIFNKAVLSLENAQFANPLFFTKAEISAFLEDADLLTFRRAQAVVGKNVHQDFDVCFPAPLINSFAAAAALFESAAASLDQDNPGLFEAAFKINDFAVQRYDNKSKGIGIHKDGLSYRMLVFIITLSGRSELFVCTDRDGQNRQVIDDTPGRLVVLRAPGISVLSAPDARPLHGVDQVIGGRLSIGFRCQIEEK